jgi:hypothetical protein
MKKVRKFEEGGYTGDDEIVKYRMGMIDAKGNDLTKSKKETYENNAPYKSDDHGLNKPYVKPEDKITSVEKTTVKNTPKSTEIKKAVTDINEMPANLRAPGYKVSENVQLPNKPDIKSKLPKKLASNSSFPSTTFKSGGKVSSASKRADGCCIRGKTKA